MLPSGHILGGLASLGGFGGLASLGGFGGLASLTFLGTAVFIFINTYASI
jgi:hypothetical protein